MALRAEADKMLISSVEGAERGVSLLEIIVVMAILGVAMTIGIGATVRWYERADAQLARAQFESAFETARFESILYQDEYALNFNEVSFRARTTQRSINIDLPEGWRLLISDPVIMSSGMCAGGPVSLSKNSNNYNYSVEPVTCEIQET